MNIDALREYGAKRRAARELKDALHDTRDVRMRNVRKPSVNETQRKWHPLNYGVMFCLHDKHYFHVCAACKRSQSEADAHREAFMLKHSISMP